MRASNILATASALAFASAQDLATVLSGQDNLSTLVNLVQSFPDIAEFITSQEDATLLAPTDEAFAAILGQGGIFSIDQAQADPGLIEQVLRYHLMRGAVPSSAITEELQFVPTFLNYSSIVLDDEVSGSNVTGGQVVGVNVQDGEVIVTSGIKATSRVVKADLTYDNGVVHIIDRLLTIPLQISLTLLTGNFTALAGAATQVGLVPFLEGASDITLFVPTNDAFQAIAGAPTRLNAAQLQQILSYHAVDGVAYSTDLANTSLPTVQGQNVNITIDADGAAFVNDARIINTDILIPGGVIHVIDSVLVPESLDLLPEGVVSEGSAVPFTSGLPAPTSTYTELGVLATTNSFVAAGLVTATSAAASTMAAATGNMSASTAMSSGAMPPQQTGNAGVRREMPFLGAALGAAALAVGL